MSPARRLVRVARRLARLAAGAAEPLVAAVAQEAHRDADDAVGGPDERLVERAAAAPSAAGATRRAPSSIIRASSPRSWSAKSGSRTTTFASRAISRLYGSMFDEPTVAQRSSIDRHLRVQERLVVLLDRRCRRRAAARTARASRSAAAGTRRAPAAAASPRTPRCAAAISARRKRMPGKKYELAIRISRFAVRIAAR